MDYDVPEEDEEGDDGRPKRRRLLLLATICKYPRDCRCCMLYLDLFTGAPEPEDIYGDLYTDQGEGAGLLHIQNSEVGDAAAGIFGIAPYYVL